MPSVRGAFYMLSPHRVDLKQRQWTQALPSIKPYYAVKCNPDPKLLNLLRQYAFGFDCASPRELSLMNNYRDDVHDSIIYANPCKSDRDIEYAKQRGSPLTVVDSAEEIDKLDMYQYTGGALIRIKVDDTGSKMPFSSKFGLSPESVVTLGEYAKKKGIQLRGISFHVGSSSNNSNAHPNAIELALKGCNQLLGLGHKADIVDIGGGFVPSDSFDQTAAKIRWKLIEKRAGVTFIAEPGRFFATESQDLFVQVIGKKPGAGGWRYTVDESLYGQFTNILFDHQKPRWIRIPRESDRERPTGKGILFGRTCDSLDVIAKSDLMEELDVGDWLWFPNMGAYTTVTASEFNGFPKPPVFLDEEGLLPDVKNINMSKSVGKIQYIEAVSAKNMLG